MTKKTTYLLGAGASYPSMPLAGSNGSANGMQADLSEMAIKTDLLCRKNGLPSSCKEALHSFSDDFRKLSKALSVHQDVDILAINFAQQAPAKIGWLKKAVSRYFLLKQLGISTEKSEHNHPNQQDNRYLVFLARLLRNNRLPDHIKILTWNYDFRLEQCANYFDKEMITRTGHYNMQELPLFEYWPGSFLNSEPCYKNLSLVHLNGIAGMYRVDGENVNPYIMGLESSDLQVKIRCISEFTNIPHSLLSFAWEKGKQAKKTIRMAGKVIEGTEVLVIIGYSFPDYNRKIDKELFEILKKRQRLKIYYQDPILDGSFLRTCFQLDAKTEIRHIRDVSQFFIP